MFKFIIIGDTGTFRSLV